MKYLTDVGTAIYIYSIYINNYSIWLMVRYMLPIVELAFEIV